MELNVERTAEALVHFLVEHSLLHAECAEDKGHPCIVVWHESAVEQVAAFLARAQSDTGPRQALSDEDVDRLVDAFLAWPLPESVRADACASIEGYRDRTGTNLLTAAEARQMFEHVLAAATARPRVTAAPAETLRLCPRDLAILTRLASDEDSTLCGSEKAAVKAALAQNAGEPARTWLRLTAAEIRDLCDFVDAHNTDIDDEAVVVTDCPAGGVEGTRTRLIAYLEEYPDEGCTPLGPDEATGARGEG